MKTETQRFERAASDIADRVRKLLADVRPVIQAKHQLDEVRLNLAVSNGVAQVMIECGKVADVPLDNLIALTYQQSGQAAT